MGWRSVCWKRHSADFIHGIIKVLSQIIKPRIKGGRPPDKHKIIGENRECISVLLNIEANNLAQPAFHAITNNGIADFFGRSVSKARTFLRRLKKVLESEIRHRNSLTVFSKGYEFGAFCEAHFFHIQ